MEMYTEQGENRMDCELKIAAKYNRPFQIFRQKEIRLGGFMGFFSKPGIQVEFYFPQNRNVVRHLTSDDLEEEKRKVLAEARKSIGSASAGGRDDSQKILDALKEIKEKVENGSKSEEHPSFKKACELLKSNDFSENYIKSMLERLRKELPLDQLDNMDMVQDKILRWIGESISIYREEEIISKPRVIVLVGPTGVGKTTTISKLAAIYKLGTEEIPPVDVRLITIDAFRIGAQQQIETIGYIMKVPVSCVVSKENLKKEISLYSSETEIFFIDTIGKSPKDSAKLGEMKEILNGCPRNAEFHLVISAATKTSDIEEIMRQFEPFNYKSVILTKMDETDRIGNIISALAEKRKCVSYITDGQGVPMDIRRASVVRFLTNLEGFTVNRDKIEERFPSGEAEQFKWR